MLSNDNIRSFHKSVYDDKNENESQFSYLVRRQGVQLINNEDYRNFENTTFFIDDKVRFEDTDKR